MDPQEPPLLDHLCIPHRTRRLTALRASAVVLLLVVLAPLGATPAQAAAKPPTQANQPVVQSWALAPTGDNPNEPSSRPSLSYTANPGTTVHDSVTLWNYGNVQLTFRVYATDALNNASGEFDLLPGTQKPKDLGAWISLPVAAVTVPALHKVDLPITLTIPAGATPGDHAAAILASNQAEGVGPDGKVVTVDRRTGTRVYLRVGGPLRPALAVTRAHSVYHASLDPRHGSLDVTYTVRNVGNVRLGAAQALAVKNLFGRTTKRTAGPTIAELLPGNEVTYKHHFKDVPATVRTGAQITLTPKAVDDTGGAKLSTTSHTASTWAVPWLLLLLAVLITLVVRGIRWYQHRRDAAHGGGGSPPAGSGPGGPAGPAQPGDQVYAPEGSTVPTP